MQSSTFDLQDPQLDATHGDQQIPVSSPPFRGFTENSGDHEEELRMEIDNNEGNAQPESKLNFSLSKFIETH